MVLTQVSPPSALPLSLSEAKEELKISDNSFDETLNRLLRSSTDRVEQDTGQRLVTQTWDYYTDCLHEVMRIPYPPLQSVTYVKYLDADGAWQTLSTDLYVVDTDSFPGNIHRAYNATWPTVQTIKNAVNIRFVAGYGAPTAVPPRLIDLILLDMKLNFEATEDRYYSTLSERLEGMIMRERVTWL